MARADSRIWPSLCCRQLVHTLECEEGWINDLQKIPFADWNAEDCSTMTALLACKERIRGKTRAYLVALTEEQLNTACRSPNQVGPASPGLLRLSYCTSSLICFITKARLRRCCEFSDIHHPTQICRGDRFVFCRSHFLDRELMPR